MDCLRCQRHLPLDAYTPDGLRRRRCRACAAAIVARCTKGTLARRLLFNLRARCRQKRLPEMSVWTLSDMEQLLKQWTPPAHYTPRLRVVKCDATKPFLPNNAKIAAFGEGLT